MIRCHYCGEEVDPSTALQRITGWESKGTGTRRGGSDILARERLQDFAHRACVDSIRSGVNVGQEQLV